MDKSKKKIEYSSLDQRSHVLHRPDMYIGSVKSLKQECYIADKDNYNITKKEINYNPGLDRIFIEALSNAIDNVWRSDEFDEKCTKIKININPETGETIVWNDGLSIPTEKNEKTGLYNVEMIFGNLLTSSNYNDKEERKTSGRNGLGIKLSSIFSKSFCVKTVDPKNEKMYEQTWEDNMSKRNEAKIKSSKLKHGYTEVSWTPDFQKFGCEGYSEDMLAIYYKHVIDCAMITKVNVYLNDVKIPVKNLQEYAQLYLNEEKEEEEEDDEKDKKKKKVDNILFITHEGCEVVLTPNQNNDFDAISFVNGVETYEGGVHVESWSSALFKPILEKINGAGKKGTPQLTLKDVKQFFRLFLNCSLVNPEFTSQEKTKLSAPNVKTKIETKHITNIMKWDVIEKIKDIIRSKELLALKKTEKKKGFKKIEGYDPANNAGGKWSQDCTLILCEGLSAKTYAVMGIEVGAYGKKGRDWYGIYPLRGKVLNTRNASTTSISKNREITDIIQALGLRFGLDYTDDKNFNTLNYGKLMLLTDQDDDGIHISGLIINMFHSLFPSLIKREKSFLITMKTPLIRIYQKNKDICFYSMNEYKKYIEEKGKVEGRVKYFKGLGTSNEKEVKDSFGKKIVEYIEDDKTDENINKVFHTKFSDVRKTWLESYDPNNIVLDNEDDNVNKMTYSDFMDHEMIKFSIDDCKRSIPNLIDGLKESHRKILYSCFLKNLKHSGKTLKVAQLAGFVAEKTNYHHGEQCLYDTITKMAHEFPGSNNIPLLFRDGQFGCRAMGGKDAASARYIFTKLEALTRLIFREEDDILLERIQDDGELVEPRYFVPILPMVLVNGITGGIGTGWSCSIPNFNPVDIIKAIKIWLEENTLFEDDEKSISKIGEILPWYRGFTGKVEKISPNKFATYGHVKEEKQGVHIVDELPIGLWTEKFKENVETLLEEKEIKSYKNYSTSDKINFIINENNNGISCNLDTLKLKTTFTTTNMVLFSENDTIKKYDTIDEIIDSFCKVRFDYYIKRKKHILNDLKEVLKYANNKYRFLSEVMDEKLKVHKRDEKDLIKDLESRGYDKKLTKKEEKEEDDEEEKDEKGSYRYLLDLKIRSFTKQKLEELKKEIDGLNQRIKETEKISEKQMWINDLNEFEVGYQKWLDEMNKKETKGKKKTKKDKEDEE